MIQNLSHISKWTKTALLSFLLALLFCSNNSHSELPTLGDPTLGSFSTKEEIKLGQAFYHALRANLEFIEDNQLNHYLKSLGQRLVSHSDTAGQSFHFFIIRSPAINAFAGPDAYIGINSGLFLESANESQLASVMAHEISHVSQRHLARAIDKSGNSAIASFATVLAAILLGSQDPQAGQAVLMTGIAGTQQASLNFTRSNEYEADRIGIGILTKAGINPLGMVEFFETLLAQSSGSGFEYLRTHPLSINRVSEAKDRIKKYQLKLPSDSDDFQFARARLAVLTNMNPASIAESDVPTTNIVDTYKRAVALIKTHESEKAITLLKKLSGKHNHPWIKLALAEAYTQNKQDKSALKLLARLSDLYPGYLPVTLAYAKSLTNNHQAQQSITLLKHQLQSDDEPAIHKALARAYFVNGQISAALESTGNQYAKEGYIELALQQYESAIHQPGTSHTAKQRLETKKQALKAKLQK